jgi:hypothetical protein
MLLYSLDRLVCTTSLKVGHYFHILNLTYMTRADWYGLFNATYQSTCGAVTDVRTRRTTNNIR